MKALLVLAGGLMFEGESLGAPGETSGETVFNTSMTGYQEILTDPSYKGQIVLMSYPLIGNYGINSLDFEAKRPFLEGFIVKEGSALASNWRAEGTLDEFLRKYNIVGIQNIDTRFLTGYLRDKGSQAGIISTLDLEPQHLLEKVKKVPGLIARDLVKEVTCTNTYEWKQGEWDINSNEYYEKGDSSSLVIVYDYGIKRNILRQLVANGFRVRVVPAHTPAEEVLRYNPQGVFLSNGPGDPEGVPYAVENVRKLIGKLPLFGICLGHQILGLALGAKRYKLKFGHHGANHPVKNLFSGKIEITAQNHNFALSKESLEILPGVEISHLNLYDNTVEGIRHQELPLFSVQYHPEASPGPHDSHYLFPRFRKVIKEWEVRKI